MTNSNCDETDESQGRSPRYVRNRVLAVAVLIAFWQLILAPGVLWIAFTTSGHPVAFTPWTMYELESTGIYYLPPHIGGVVLPAQFISLFIIFFTMMIVCGIVATNREMDSLRVRRPT